MVAIGRDTKTQPGDNPSDYHLAVSWAGRLS